MKKTLVLWMVLGSSSAFAGYGCPEGQYCPNTGSGGKGGHKPSAFVETQECDPAIDSNCEWITLDQSNVFFDQDLRSQ